MKQTRRVLLECIGEIRQIYKATNVMIKCVEASGGRRHYYLPGRIRNGFMDQGTVELVSVQIKGKADRTKKKKEKCIVLYKQNNTCSIFRLLKILFDLFHNVNFNLLLKFETIAPLAGFH